MPTVAQILAEPQYELIASPPRRAIPESNLEGGPLVISGGGGPGRAEILPPNAMSQAAPSAQAQMQQLREQEMALARLRPFVPSLIKLGVTQDQMLKMNPTEAYQFVKSRSPMGMGTVDRGADQTVGNAINQLNSIRRALGEE